MTNASIGSVLARLPRACAKARTWRRIDASTTGKPAPANPAATMLSKPQVAYQFTCSGRLVRSNPWFFASLAMSSSTPAPARATAKLSARWENIAHPTDPLKHRCRLNDRVHPVPSCARIGLRKRPLRLFGFDGIGETRNQASADGLQGPRLDGSRVRHRIREHSGFGRRSSYKARGPKGLRRTASLRGSHS